MTHACYIYFDETWSPYYVGKGNKRRATNDKAHTVPVPSFIQYFYFTKEWEAFECEVELISFYGRLQDGGVLMNRCVGGPGTPGFIMPEETKQKIGRANSGRVMSSSQRKQISRTLTGRKLPKATCKKMSASRKGVKRSPETKRKMAEAMKASWARRRACKTNVFNGGTNGNT